MRNVGAVPVDVWWRRCCACAGKYVGNRPIKMRKSTWQDRALTVVQEKKKKQKKEEKLLTSLLS